AATDYVDAILEAVSRLSKLIDDVLDLTQGDTRGIVLEGERVDIAGLCRMALEAVQSRAGEKNQKIEAVVSENAGFAFADARRLRESIEHVLDNAVAYTAKRGRIRLEAGGDETNATIRISDNGIGISKEDL